MEALILFSHGSVLCGAGRTLHEHAERLRARGEFERVEVGFLNYSRPTFAEAVARCADAGATRIVVLPYFLVPGVFVRADLPKAIDAARAAWPDLDFTVAEPIGFDDALADAILELAADARGAKSWREDLERAPQFCQKNPRCPLYGRELCPLTPAGAAV